MKRFLKTGEIAVLIAWILFFFLSEAQAQIYKGDLPNREGFKKGNILIHAALKTEIDFESNVFLAEENEKYDMITRVIPSVGVEIPMADNRLSLEYDTEIIHFDRSSEQDSVNHIGRASLDLYWTDFKITSNDIYRRFTNRAGSDETGVTGIRTREEHNEFDISVATEFDQLSYKLTYANRIRNFLDKNELLFGPMNYDDRNNMYNELDLEAGYLILPKTELVLEGVGGRLSYSSRLVPDSYYTEALVGVRGEWFGKLVVDGRIGAKYQEYDTASFVREDNYVDFSARGELDFSLTEDDSIGLNFTRTNQDSIYQNINYYTLNFIGADYTHYFTDKLSTNTFLSWQYNRYPKETTESTLTAIRRDTVYNSGALLRYDVRNWFAVEGEYEYSRRDSKFPEFDYKDHIFTVRATIGF